MSYRARLRNELPDRPGALARVAGVIAYRGGNVVSVDVQEVDGDHVVDEIVADLPEDVSAADLRAALEEERAGFLLSASAPRPYDDPVLRALQWASAVVEIDRADRSDRLAAAFADICSASACWTSSPADATAYAVGRFALDRGAPVAQLTDAVPASLAPELQRSAWLLAVPDDSDRPTRVAFLARPPGLRFTATEISRVVALLRLARRLDGQPSLQTV